MTQIDSGVPVDVNREIRGMILAALPYPPLPVMLKGMDEENRLTDERVVNSHDIIAQMINVAACRQDKKANGDRKMRQGLVLSGFIADLVKDGVVSVEKLYEILCRRTQEHVSTYLPENCSSMSAICFLPSKSVCKGDSVHAKMCDYMAAQAVLLDLKTGNTSADWSSVEYEDMLLAAKERIVCEGDPVFMLPREPDGSDDRSDDEDAESD